MTTDKREHEAGDDILLVDQGLLENGGVCCLYPAPAVANCDLAHAHLHLVTLQLDASSCYTANFDPDMHSRVFMKWKAISFDIRNEFIPRK